MQSNINGQPLAQSVELLTLDRKVVGLQEIPVLCTWARHFLLIAWSTRYTQETAPTWLKLFYLGAKHQPKQKSIIVFHIIIPLDSDSATLMAIRAFL